MKRLSAETTGRGFTIIEVLVAVGLTSLLMAAMYSAMNIYWTSATDSYEEIERGQIARAILREMARDIQSATFVEQDTSESDDDGDSDEAVDADTAMASYTNGLFGSSSDLVLYISRPDRTNSYVAAQEVTSPADRSSDAMIGRYLLAEKGAGGLSGELASDSIQGNSSETIVGLGRMQGDLSGLSLAISNGDVDMQKQASQLLAKEVSGITFEYWDGVELQTEWDSTVQNAMPIAIVVNLTLRTLTDPQDARTPENIPGWMPESVHRLVVPILVAPPYVGETSI